MPAPTITPIRNGGEVLTHQGKFYVFPRWVLPAHDMEACGLGSCARVAGHVGLHDPDADCQERVEIEKRVDGNYDLGVRSEYNGIVAQFTPDQIRAVIDMLVGALDV